MARFHAHPVPFWGGLCKTLCFAVMLLLPCVASAYDVTSDFPYRDSLPQTHIPKSEWFKPVWGTWGPPAKLLPKPTIPAKVDRVKWKQARIVAAAKHYIGLPYKRADGMRGHFPDRGCGLDCSNFVAWVYNFGLGMKISSDVDVLSRGCKKDLPLQKGDLIFFNTTPRHVMIYINENYVIDSTSTRESGVQVRDLRKIWNQWCVPDRNNSYYLGGKRFITP